MNSLLQHVAKGGSLYDEAGLVGDPDERAETVLFETSLLDAPRPPNYRPLQAWFETRKGQRRHSSRCTLFGPCQQCELARVAGAACPRPPESIRGHHQWGASPSRGQPGTEPRSQGLIGKRDHNVYRNIAERGPARPRHRVTAPPKHTRHGGAAAINLSSVPSETGTWAPGTHLLAGSAMGRGV